MESDFLASPDSTHFLATMDSITPIITPFTDNKVDKDKAVRHGEDVLKGGMKNPDELINIEDLKGKIEDLLIFIFLYCISINCKAKMIF